MPTARTLAALSCIYDPPPVTDITVCGYATTGPVGLPLLVTTREEVPPWSMTEYRTVETGDTTLDDLMLPPAGEVRSAYRRGDGLWRSARIPGLRRDGQALSFDGDTDDLVPWSSSPISARFTYRPLLTPMALEALASADLRFPITMVRLNGEHASADLPTSTSALYVVACDGGSVGNAITLEVVSLGAAERDRTVLVITDADGTRCTLTLSVNGIAHYASLGALALEINRLARSRTLPIAALGDDTEAVFAVQTVTLSGGDDGLTVYSGTSLHLPDPTEILSVIVNTTAITESACTLVPCVTGDEAAELTTLLSELDIQCPILCWHYDRPLTVSDTAAGFQPIADKILGAIPEESLVASTLSVGSSNGCATAAHLMAALFIANGQRGITGTQLPALVLGDTAPTTTTEARAYATANIHAPSLTPRGYIIASDATLQRSLDAHGMTATLAAVRCYHQFSTRLTERLRALIGTQITSVQPIEALVDDALAEQPLIKTAEYSVTWMIEQQTAEIVLFGELFGEMTMQWVVRL